MKKLILATMAITTLATSFVVNPKNKQINNPINFQFQIVINNQTSNVIGGNPFNFGTWLYLDLSMNGYKYTVNDFNNIVIENNTNSGGSGGSAGRTGDMDVFVTPLHEKTTILSVNVNYKDDINIDYFTFGTFYYGLGFDHAQLASSVKGFFCYMHDEYNKTGNDGARLDIYVGGNAGSNDADYTLNYYKS